MKFEWDPRKNRSNRIKHGISFEQALFVFSDPDLISLFDVAHTNHQEERWITIGLVQDLHIVVVIHTHRNSYNEEIIRIISARFATKNEEQQYSERKGKNK